MFMEVGIFIGRNDFELQGRDQIYDALSKLFESAALGVIQGTLHPSARFKIDPNCQHFIPVTAIVLHTDQFNQWLADGHPFAQTVCKMAVLLHGEKSSVPESINAENKEDKESILNRV